MSKYEFQEGQQDKITDVMEMLAHIEEDITGKETKASLLKKLLMLGLSAAVAVSILKKKGVL